MASISRTAQLVKVQKVLKKRYKPVFPNAELPVLEHLLFACCLEDAHYDVAEEAFAALVETFFDWNEVRVTTVRELSEVMARLPDPAAAAHRLKRVLQHVFESTYTFDLEGLRKKNLGPAIARLKKIDGSTNFSVAYVVQSTLGGHAIPIDSGVMGAFQVLELVRDEDVEAGMIPGLERAVPKSKGIEFGSQLHQLGADFTANPFSQALRETLLLINPEVKDRLPKRRARKRQQPATGVAEQAIPESPKKRRQAATDQAEEPPQAEPEAPASAGKKRAGRRKEKASQDKATKKTPAAKRKPATAKKKSTRSTPKDESSGVAKSSSSAGRSKPKPR